MRIWGSEVYDYNPTVFERDENRPYFIGNFEHLNNLFGITLPRSVWMKLEPGVSGKQVQENVARYTGLGASIIQDARLVAVEYSFLDVFGAFCGVFIGVIAS